MRQKILKNTLFTFFVLLITLPLVKASSLPPIINFILNGNDTELDSSPNPEFDPTVLVIPKIGAYHGALPSMIVPNDLLLQGDWHRTPISLALMRLKSFKFGI